MLETVPPEGLSCKLLSLGCYVVIVVRFIAISVEPTSSVLRVTMCILYVSQIAGFLNLLYDTVCISSSGVLTLG